MPRVMSIDASMQVAGLEPGGCVNRAVGCCAARVGPAPEVHARTASALLPEVCVRWLRNLFSSRFLGGAASWVDIPTDRSGYWFAASTNRCPPGTSTRAR